MCNFIKGFVNLLVINRTISHKKGTLMTYVASTVITGCYNFFQKFTDFLVVKAENCMETTYYSHIVGCRLLSEIFLTDESVVFLTPILVHKNNTLRDLPPLNCYSCRLLLSKLQFFLMILELCTWAVYSCNITMIVNQWISRYLILLLSESTKHLCIILSHEEMQCIEGSYFIISINISCSLTILQCRGEKWQFSTIMQHISSGKILMTLKCYK